MSRAVIRAGLGAWLLAIVLSPAASAQERWLAFGDSITAGLGDDEDAVETGYPPRLEARLSDAGTEVEIVNEGLAGERTAEGLTRIDEILPLGGETLLLMEGTNDISTGVSRETTVFNLSEMARKAVEQGFDRVAYATLLPRTPIAKQDPMNFLNQQLAQGIRDLAAAEGRLLVDVFQGFATTPNAYPRLYWDNMEDEVGHPNAEGYDLMTDFFFDVVTGVDSMPPVLTRLEPPNGATGVPADARIELELVDFGSGVDLDQTQLLVNGAATGVVPSGSPDRATLAYQPPEPLAGEVSVRLQTRDLGTPPNTMNREVASFFIVGSSPVEGDVDEDGRVDGADLVQFARFFGSVRGDGRYRAFVDFNNDGLVDGTDLSVLASNFGRTRG